MELLGLISFPVWLQWILLICGVLYWYSNRNNNYWKKLGIDYDPAVSNFTVLRSLLTDALPDMEIEKYKKYGRIYGAFEASNPILTVGDPDLLRNILVKDFNTFPFRKDLDFGDSIVNNMVFALNGEKWKRVRTTVTPAFTSGKMRKIASIINDSAKTTVQNFLTASEKGIDVDCKRIFGAFTMDVIASSAFATKIDSHNDPNNPFVTHGRNSFSTDIFKLLLFILFPPFIIKLLRTKIFDGNATNFFRDVTLQVMEERKKKSIRGNDFLQMMIDAAKEDVEANKTIDGFKMLDLEEEEEEEDLGHGQENKEVFKIDYRKTLTRDELVAQCVLFFMVGYETTAATLSFCAYNLALNPDCQEKLIKEVDEAFEKHEVMTYDVVRDMKYLSWVISETLRMYPPLIRLVQVKYPLSAVDMFNPSSGLVSSSNVTWHKSEGERRAAEDYKLGDTGITVPKGMIVGFPIYAIHHDQEFYPDPETFDPERFSPENQHDRPTYAYLPFGAGPRNCLGMRFALMEVKLCLANALRHLRFRKSPETKVPLEFQFALGFLQPKSLLLAVEKRNDVPK